MWVCVSPEVLTNVDSDLSEGKVRIQTLKVEWKRMTGRKVENTFIECKGKQAYTTPGNTFLRHSIREE